jgi:tetratricopeptide (TPR) repeat protein
MYCLTRLLAGFLLVLLSACASITHFQPPADLPQSVEIARTPFYPQRSHQCGPSALAMLLNFHHQQVTPDELTDQIYLPARKGSLQIELASAARHHGFLAYRLAPELSELFSEVAAGNPLIVLQNLGFSWYPLWHYAVVIGYDLKEGQILLRSGTDYLRKISLTAFINTWGRSGNWALVVTPPGHIPHTAEPTHFLRTVYDLEQVGKLAAANVGYRAATTRWVDSDQTWLALGNSSYTLGDYNGAYEAFQKAVRIDPDNPDAWNNLAYALMKLGCPEAAINSIEKALKLKPGDDNLVSSRIEVIDWIKSNKDLQCSLPK